MAFSDQNRTLKKNYEAVQHPTTRPWFLLDYSLSHYQIESLAIVFPSSLMINFRIYFNIFDLYIKFWIREFDLKVFFYYFKVSCTLPNIDSFYQTKTSFAPIRFIKDKITKIYPKCIYGKFRPYYLSCRINSFLYNPACKTWLFEKIIFELEASDSFKITCILVR